MLFTTRRAVTASLNTSLLAITSAADIISSSLLAIDKGIYWCSSKIDENMSAESKAAWIEHEAQLRGFTSANALKAYNEAVAKKAAEEEQAELEELAKKEVKEEQSN